MRFTISACLTLVLLSLRGAIAFECAPLVTRDPSPAQVKFSRGLLWQITAPNSSRSYLFGTIHLSASKVDQPTPQVMKALLASSTFGMEVLLDLDAMLQVADTMHNAAGHSLQSMLEPRLYAETLRLLANYGVDTATADTLKPWAAYTTLSLPPGDNSAPLDLVLLGTAQRGKKHTFGLESLTEQTEIFEHLDSTAQVQLLTEAVCHHTELQTDTSQLIAHYKQRDLAAVYTLANHYDSAVQRQLSKALLHDRNRRLAERMEPYMRTGKVFVAIGALHLPGDDGVLARLAARGFEVRRVE